MSASRILIDTNVLIALEDPGRTDAVAADFARRTQTGGATIFLHQAIRDDLARDRNRERHATSSSRLRKYPVLSSIPSPPPGELEALFGPIRHDNDRVDVALLHALSMNVVDVLVSQDDGIHLRVRGGPLEERVLTLADAVAWLRSLQDPVDDGLPQVADVPAYSLAADDPIFDGINADYPAFRGWWQRKCVGEHRPCWVVRRNGDGIGGIVVRKEENGTELGMTAGRRVLKLCTFKVATPMQGYKVGELLLRKSLWHAQANGYDAVYLTAFDHHWQLIDLLTRYGFEPRGGNDSGEAVLVKEISRERLVPRPDENRAETSRRNYPRFSIEDPVRVFAVPVQWRFHRQLFPENAMLTPLPLFGDATSRWTRMETARPANTIRKVYVCRAKSNAMQGGDLVFFYQSKDASALHSQCLTTVGVVEQVRRARGAGELRRLTAGRSVFSEGDLDALADGATDGVTVLDFLLVGHLDPAIHLRDLVAAGVLKAQPQSITAVPKGAISAVIPAMKFGFAL